MRRLIFVLAIWGCSTASKEAVERPEPLPAPVATARAHDPTPPAQVEPASEPSSAPAPSLDRTAELTDWLADAQNPCVRSVPVAVRVIGRLESLLPARIDGVEISRPGSGDLAPATVHGAYNDARAKRGIALALIHDLAAHEANQRVTRDWAKREAVDLRPISPGGFSGHSYFDKKRRTSNAFVPIADAVEVRALVDGTDDADAALRLLEALDLAAVRTAVCK